MLYEEFGVNTQWPDGPSHWRDLRLWGGRAMRAHFASEEDGAEYVGLVLQRLLRVGSLGAFIWCFADYTPDLWALPPCDLRVHERFFGLVRSDGTLKPTAHVVEGFAQSAPMVRPPERIAELDGSTLDYYRDPDRSIAAMYEKFGTLAG